MKRLLLILLSVLLCACTPVLKSALTQPPDTPPEKVDRALLKGFVYKQSYLTGTDKSSTPSVGVGYTITKIAQTIAQTISVWLGFSTTTITHENFGDIGTLRTAVKDCVEDQMLAKGVLTLEERQQLGLAPVPNTVILEGKGDNDAVEGATPWYWGAWNVVDYVTLMAFVGMPVQYQKEATVSLAVYNQNYEMIAKYKGYARVGQATYVAPHENLVEATLKYAYQDAINRAAKDWKTVRAQFAPAAPKAQ